MTYTSIENEHIKEIKKLNQKKYRDLSNKFIVEGEHIVNEAIKANIVEEILLLEGNEITYKGKVSFVTIKVLKYITELENPSKVIAVCKKINNVIKGNHILALDNIQDPGNLGTIIRSAVAFNIDTIILSKNTVDLYNSKVLRSTQGMIFNINIVVSDLEKEIKELKNKNYKILTTKVDGGNLIKNIEKKENNFFKLSLLFSFESKNIPI